MLHKIPFCVVLFLKNILFMILGLELMALLAYWIMGWGWPFYVAAIAAPVFSVVNVVSEIRKMEMAEFLRCIEKM